MPTSAAGWRTATAHRLGPCGPRAHGSLCGSSLAPGQARAGCSVRKASRLRNTRKLLAERSPGCIAFDAPLWRDRFGPNWLSMVIYNRGRFWIDRNADGRRFRYELCSLHTFMFCLSVPHDPTFPAHQQFLHLGEAGLATLMTPVVVSRFIAPEAERENWGCDLVSAVVPEAAEVGQPTACQLALPRRRGFHRR